MRGRCPMVDLSLWPVGRGVVDLKEELSFGIVVPGIVVPGEAIPGVVVS